MASTGHGGSLPPNFLLTPQQQSLLFAALNSNKQQLPASNASNSISLSPTSFQTSPVQSKSSHHKNFQESPFLDNYDYDFGDSSFDFSFASNADESGTLIGDLPDSVAKSNSSENEGNEKRSHPDDEDDADTPGNDPKRRESTEKVSKKPGRKPLTSSPLQSARPRTEPPSAPLESARRGT